MTVDKVMDEQRGFRSGRGCRDQIFTVKQIVKTIEKDKKMYIVFVGLEKVYDNVSREKLWKVLDEHGVKGKLLRVIQGSYVDGKARVNVGGVEAELFGVHRGVRQGCTLSLWLFADDMVVMAESVEGLQSNLQVLSDVLSRW